MSERRPTNEERLAEVLSGELSAEERERLLADAPELRAEVERLEALGSRVEAAAAFEREILDEALAGSPTAAEDALLAAARERFAPTTRPTSPPSPPSLWPIGFAAAALLAVALFLRAQARLDGPSDPATLPTLGARIELVAPLGVVSAYDEFRWQYPLENGYAFELTLWDDATGEELYTTPRLRETRWTPPRSVALPLELRWAVYVLDATGEIVASSEGTALRSL